MASLSAAQALILSHSSILFAVAAQPLDTPQLGGTPLIYVLYLIHIFTCFFLILVVLLQQGKGADFSGLGGGATQTTFGARGAATLLHKLTVGCFVLFIMTTLSIGIVQRGATGPSVFDAEPDADGVTEPADGSPAPEDSTAEDALPTTDRVLNEASDGDAAPSEEGEAPSEGSEEATEESQN